MQKVTIHTDGGCSGNPGPGGWAVVLRHGDQVRELSGGEPATTNNRMELRAAIEGFRALPAPHMVEIFTDSVYVKDGITKWLTRWKRNGWITTARQPVKNADLWRELDAVTAPHRIEWRWLKGHAGHPDNERCDELARAQIAALRERPAPAPVKSLPTLPIQAELLL
ncbi:MAG: Ribonuclease HI [Verrucomicrobiae bacterium]|nr:Ribonuclease HI [Verrucomicrobiae bacterium]